MKPKKNNIHKVRFKTKDGWVTFNVIDNRKPKTTKVYSHSHEWNYYLDYKECVICKKKIDI